jgi:2,5-diamino-6-(ribosylamino)-4(3H)-pyrimidinone 5'-phosphate reductase
VDAIMVGISTIITDDPCLTVRRVKGKDPVRIIVDSNAKIPLSSQILETASKVKTIIAVTDQAPAYRIQKIKDRGAQIIMTKAERAYQDARAPNKVNLKQLLSTLKIRKIRKILVEGGGELNWSLLRLGLANEIILTIAPKIIGGREAITFVEGEGFDKIINGINLKLIKIKHEKKTDEIVLHYKLCDISRGTKKNEQ